MFVAAAFCITCELENLQCQQACRIPIVPSSMCHGVHRDSKQSGSYEFTSLDTHILVLILTDNDRNKKLRNKFEKFMKSETGDDQMKLTLSVLIGYAI